MDRFDRHLVARLPAVASIVARVIDPCGPFVRERIANELEKLRSTARQMVFHLESIGDRENFLQLPSGRLSAGQDYAGVTVVNPFS